MADQQPTQHQTASQAEAPAEGQGQPQAQAQAQAQAQVQARGNEPRPDQGASPYPPPGPPGASLQQRAELPPAPRRVVRGIADGRVSWEERRKGLPPQPITTIDQLLYAERFESQEQAIDQPNPAWRSAPQLYPADMPPDSPPRIEPGQQSTRSTQANQLSPSSTGNDNKPTGS